MLKKFTHSRPMQETLGFLAASYLRFVHATTAYVREPEDIVAIFEHHWPPIVAMWHGQHIMVPFGTPPGRPASALISRHGDAEINAVVLRRLGVEGIRGSGGSGEKILQRGGVAALRAMARALEAGKLVALTADVPKTARVAGRGIVTLARLSGRPIFPAAVVSSRRFEFDSWDRASLAKPFGRGAMVVGAPILVAADADAAALEAARQAVESGLDAVHDRAYALVGQSDRGGGDRGGGDRGGGMSRQPT
jgi:lysophospholipid acyltransferase (LPLAT)-like uncharacterized protein